MLGAYTHGGMGTTVGCCKMRNIGKEYEIMQSTQVGYQLFDRDLSPLRIKRSRGEWKGLWPG